MTICHILLKTRFFGLNVHIADSEGLSSTTVIFWPQTSDYGEITQNNGYYAVQIHSRSPLSVVAVNENGKPICDFLLVNNNSNLQSISTVSKISRLIFQFSPSILTHSFVVVNP